MSTRMTLAALWVAGALACSDGREASRPIADEPVTGEPATDEPASGAPVAFVPAQGLRVVDPPAALGALAPQLTAGPGGVVLSWLEAASERHVLRFARFSDGALAEDGDSADWLEPRDVVSGTDFFANWADVPSVLAVTSDELLAHWLRKNGDSTYAYGIRLRRSTDGGAAWQDLGWLHDDGTPTEHGFVSLVASEGSVRAFWLDGREMTGHHGAGGDMAVRTALVSGGEVGPSEVLDARTCECCQTEAALTADGFLVAYRDRSDAEIRDNVVVRATADGWQPPRILAEEGWRIPACPVNGPAVAAQDRRVALAWFTAADQQPRVRLAFSKDAGASFGAPLEVAPAVIGQRPAGRVDVTLTRDGGAVVSWLSEADTSAEDTGRAGVALAYFDAEGRRGSTVLLGETSTARASGVPRVQLVDTPAGAAVLVVWRETGETARLRAVTVPVESLQVESLQVESLRAAAAPVT